MTHPAPTEKLPAAVRARIRRYRLAALASVAFGLVGAATIYWRGARAPDFSDDPSMLGFNRPEERQMGVLYGKQGQLIEDLNHSLKQPGTQALLVGAAAGLIAAGCFQFSRILAQEAEAGADNGKRDA